MERFRLFISQIVAGIVVAVLAIWFCRSVAINAGLVNRFYSHQIDSVFITLLIGLLVVAALAVKLILWLIKEPMLVQEEVDLGTIENIPESK